MTLYMIWHNCYDTIYDIGLHDDMMYDIILFVCSIDIWERGLDYDIMYTIITFWNIIIDIMHDIIYDIRHIW